MVKLNGVGVSSDYRSGTFAIGTTRGKCHFFGEIEGVWIHCIKLFEFGYVVYDVSAGDDGTVGVWRVHQSRDFPVMAVKKRNLGGGKAVDVNGVGAISMGGHF
jgi:hypothetical protein